MKNKTRWYWTQTETITSEFVKRTETTAAWLSVSENYSARQEPFGLLCMKHCGWLKSKKRFTLFFSLRRTISLRSPMICGSAAWWCAHSLTHPCWHRFANTVHKKKKKKPFRVYNHSREGLTYPFWMHRSHFDFCTLF